MPYLDLMRFVRPSFFKACQASAIGTFIHSGMNFVVVETIHLIALAVLIGTVLAVDLRLFGFGTRRQSAAEFLKEFLPWTWAALGVMIFTGILLFISEAVRLGESTQFFYKMIFLIAAVIFQSTVFVKLVRNEVNESTRWSGKLIGGVSLFLWLSIALLGRAISFSYLLPFMPVR